MRRSMIARILLLGLSVALLASCAGLRYRYPSDSRIASLLSGPPPEYPAARFAVLSDAHLYDTGLGTQGNAFQEYLSNDRKLIVQSEELLVAAIQRIQETKVGFVLICGDLTKDGERQDHLLMARELSALRKAGIKAFVVPGNHDINNPHAMSYSDKGATQVAGITPAEFQQTYRDYGYGEAITRDPGSLSYVAEPVPGLWLLAIDTANYASNRQAGGPVTASGLTQAREDWIEGALIEARRQGKAVIAMMHHGAVEHFKGEERHYGEYLVNGWRQFSGMLAAYGVRAVFTGHFHSQDVALSRTGPDRFVFDIETGSLVTYPDPLRFVEIHPDQRMVITSSTITELPSFKDRGAGFGAYSRQYLEESVNSIAAKTLVGLGVPEAEARSLTPQITAAVEANLVGDERFTGTEMLRTKGLSFMGGVVVAARKDLVAGLWNDPEPADNNLTINLRTGSWTAP